MWKKVAIYSGVALAGVAVGLFLATTKVGASVLGVVGLNKPVGSP